MRDPKKKINQLLREQGVSVRAFVRFQVGQAGITTSKLRQAGTYLVQAQFLPSLPGYTRSSTRLEISTGFPLATAFSHSLRTL